MTVSPRAFYVSLYREHLEEASFLFDHRRALLANPKVFWPRVADFEERLEANLDALVIGGELALEICQKQTVEGDAGELHAAVRVFCRQQRKDLVEGALRALDFEDPAKVCAVAEALAAELPAEWVDLVRPLLVDPKETKGIGLAVDVLGTRRLAKADELLTALGRAPAKAVPTILEALGRLRAAAAGKALVERWMKHEDEAIRVAAVMTLLRLGERQALAYGAEAAQTQPWARMPLALAGGRAAALLLLEVLKPGAGSPDSFRALGIAGSTAAVPVLIAALGRGEEPAAAAEALHLLTGATHSPEAEPWKQWWAAHEQRFNPRVRYRLGKPFAPALLADLLEAETTPPPLRRLALDELAIRYGADFPFATDQLVVEQRRVLPAIRQWTEANAERFPAGHWFFAGQPSPF
jgi:uncharacterized protein (TIGR02270 family)